MPDLSTIVRALAPLSPPTTAPDPNTAGVAMVLTGAEDDLRLCFILRAKRDDDRWSGQMAFPGGRTEPGDATAPAVAIRETYEEVGLVLDSAELLGALPHQTLRPAGALGQLAPFVFYAGPKPLPLAPSPDEVADAYWIELRHLWAPDNSDGIDWEWKGQTMRFPGIRYREHVIWGLTYRVLISFGECLGEPLPGADRLPRVVLPRPGA